MGQSSGKTYYSRRIVIKDRKITVLVGGENQPLGSFRVSETCKGARELDANYNEEYLYNVRVKDGEIVSVQQAFPIL